MSINVTYGDVAAYGQLGALAGQAAAERTAQEQMLQVQKDQADRAVQYSAQSAQLEMQANQQGFAREMAQFDTFIKKEQIQQEHAWTVEEADTRRRHDLDIQLKGEDFKRGMELQDWSRKDSIRKRKLEALEQARKDGVIDGEEQYNSLKLALELDVEPYPESLGLAGRGGSKTGSLVEQLMKQGTGTEAAAGTSQPFVAGKTQITPENIAGILGQPENVKALAALPNPDYYPSSDILTPSGMTLALSNILPALPTAQRGKLQAVLATGNSDLIQQAFDAVKGVEPIPGEKERRARVARNQASWNKLPASVGASQPRPVVPISGEYGGPREIPAGASYEQVRANLPGWVSELSPTFILETMDLLASGKSSDEVYALVKKRGWLRK